MVKLGGSGSGKPKGELLVLDGTELVDGKLTKTKFFDFLQTDLSDYSHIAMTPDQALKFKNSIVRITHGVSAMIPQLCSGRRCMNKLCVFHDGENYPLGQQCLLETRIVQYSTMNWIEDLGVDPDSPSQMVLINELVECDIIDYRANIGLSGAVDEEAPTLLKTTIIESEHSTMEQVNLHPLLEAKEKTHRMRQKILESLAATPREKYKKAAALKKSEDTDVSSFLADLKKEFSEKTTPKANSLDKIIKDAKKVSQDLTTIDADWSSED